MEPTNSWLPWNELGKLRRGLSTAPDSQIARIVAIIDLLEERGVADDVIAPLRPRLAQLRPPRPLRFCRLLFRPLDPLIVPTADWRPDFPTIPRAALPPLAGMVRSAMGSEAHAIDALIRRHAAEESSIAHEAGSRLWPAAACILARATQPPPGWARAALPGDSFPRLAQNISTLLAQTGELNALFAEADIGVSLQVERLIPLVAAAAAGVDTLVMIVALLLARMPELSKLLVRAGSVLGRHGDATMRVAIDRAIDILLARLQNSLGIEALVVGSPLGQAAAEVRRITKLLDSLDGRESGGARQARVAELRGRLDNSCRLRFAAALEMQFVEALRALRANPPPAAVAQLEDTARGLHDLEMQARELGNAAAYDSLLQQGASLVKAMGTDQALGLVDRVRLIEILVGPEDALALLEPAETATEG